MLEPSSPASRPAAFLPGYLRGPLRYALGVATVVGGCVTMGHLAFPTHPAWPWIHFLLPVTVFSVSARRSGPISSRVVLRGVLVACTVFALFSFVNESLRASFPVRGGLNFLIPLIVSFIGAISGSPGGPPDG